ncbi:MAG: 2-hydroxyacid dehydrogenase [Planctomycetota bacterium]|jgi:D-3-phosphoglycerate dehydrogenase
MKLLAISDTYIPADFMRDGLSELEELGVGVEVRHWGHDDLIGLQQDNLAIETGGPGAVELPESITQDLEPFGIVVVQFAPISSSFIERASNLKLIGVLRGGVENVAVESATERGISVMNTPGRNARAVAECTMGMILAEIRNIARSHADLKRNNWHRSFPNSEAIPELCGKTVGLVGYGEVGRLVAGYLVAFGSRVIAFDPYVSGGARVEGVPPSNRGQDARDTVAFDSHSSSDPALAELVGLEYLLRNSDVVSLHARLTDESYHLIGAKELAMMKPTAVLVNTARSGLVDEPALIKALEDKTIIGAALDVFDEEPLPADHPFIRLGNATITAHLAGSTIDSFRNSPKMMAGHLKNCLTGGENLPVVNGIRPLPNSEK